MDKTNDELRIEITFLQKTNSELQSKIDILEQQSKELKNIIGHALILRRKKMQKPN